jgi:hypothetical protein
MADLPNKTLEPTADAAAVRTLIDSSIKSRVLLPRLTRLSAQLFR